MPFRATCNTFILKDDSKVRIIKFHKDYFDEFYSKQRPNVKAKIVRTILLIEKLKIVLIKFLKHLTGTKGLYEIRIKSGTDIFRIFCFFYGIELLILVNGFQKKTQKTPISEINKALQIKYNYENEK